MVLASDECAHEMQQVGQLMNPRDERGWQIPRHGTARRKVYDMMTADMKPKEIMQSLGISRPNFNSHRYFITAWEKANRNVYLGKQR